MPEVCHAQSCNFSSFSLSRIENALSSLESTVNHRMTTVEAEVAAVGAAVALVRSELSSLSDRFEEHREKVERYHEVGIAETRVVKFSQELEVRFSPHKEVRRIARGIIEGAHLDIVRLDSILSMAEETALKSPGYWLPPTILALAGWLKNDRGLATRAVGEALRRNRPLTSLFFALLCYSAGRGEAGDVWLDLYLSLQDPRKMEKPAFTLVIFVGIGGARQGISAVVKKWLEKWFSDFSADSAFIQGQKDFWSNYIHSDWLIATEEERYQILPQHLSQWEEILQVFTEIKKLDRSVDFFFSLRSDLGFSPEGLLAEQVGKLLEGLVFSLDHEEEEFERGKRLNELIIECEGDRERAQELFDKEIGEADRLIDFSSILRPDFDNIEDEEARAIARMAISLGTQFFKETLWENYDSFISRLPDSVTMTIGDWSGVYRKPEDLPDLRKNFESHLDLGFVRQLSALEITQGLKAVTGLGALGAIILLGDLSRISRIFHGLAPTASAPADTLGIGAALVGALGLGTLAVALKKIVTRTRQRKTLLKNQADNRAKALETFDNIAREMTNLNKDLTWSRDVRERFENKLAALDEPGASGSREGRLERGSKDKRRLFEGSLPSWPVLPPVLDA